MYETLLTNEECAKAEDMGNFYRVPADNRTLNYDKYFTEGDVKRVTLTEFNSDNTYRLNLEETKAKIASLEYIQNELKGLENIAKLPREKQIEVLKEKLAFRVVGDTIFNAVDLTRGMVSHEGLAMTVKAGKEAGVDPAVIEEAEAYIEALV